MDRLKNTLSAVTANGTSSQFLSEEIDGVEVRGGNYYSLRVRMQGNDFSIVPQKGTQDFHAKPSAFALPSMQTLFRTLTLPKVSSSELIPVIRSALESTLSIPIDEYEIAWKKDGAKVYCFITQKSDLLKAYTDLIDHGLKPVWIFPKALALAKAAAISTSTNEPYIILDIDESECTIVLIQNNEILDAKSTLGFKDCSTDDSWKPLREIARILLAWKESYPMSDGAKILISGSLDAQNESIVLHFLKRDVLPTSQQTENTLHRFPAFGAALLASSVDILHRTCGYQIEGCQAEEMRQWLKPLALFIGLFLLLSLTSFGIGQQFIQQRQNNLENQFQELCRLALHGKPQGFNENPKTLSELETSLDQIDEHLSTQHLYPLIPDTPKLSQLITWLSGIADTCSKDAGGPPIELSQIQYLLVRRPEKSKPKEHYQVRVDIEFTAGNATQARKFHEELLTANPYIDPKLEVKWSLSGGKWRASFFLKDKTIYFP